MISRPIAAGRQLGPPVSDGSWVAMLARPVLYVPCERAFAMAERTLLNATLVIGAAVSLLLLPLSSQGSEGGPCANGEVVISKSVESGLPPDGPYRLLKYRNELWSGSTFWTGPDWTRVGKDWDRPGRGTPSVRRFTVPPDDRVRIGGRVCKRHLDGDGIVAIIRHNERQVWRAELERKGQRGAEPQLLLHVRAGDAFRFIVKKRGQIYCDTAGWDPVIEYLDGAKERFQASAAFDAHRQGAGG